MGELPLNKRRRTGDSRQQSPPKKPRHSYSKDETKRDDKAYAAGRSNMRARNRRNYPGDASIDASITSINDLKLKIRATRRALEHSTSMPPGVRIEKERALQGYQTDLEKAEAKKKRSALIQRYHFVRFLERKSATSNLKKLLRAKSELEEDETSSKSSSKKDNRDKEGKKKPPTMSPATKAKKITELDAQIRIARVDINYAIYCPLTEKYISLFPKNADNKNPKKSGDEAQDCTSGDEADMRRKKGKNKGTPPPDLQNDPDYMLIGSASGEKPPLWYIVEKFMEDDNQLSLLRDGKLDIGLSGEKKEKKKDKGSGKSAMAESLPVLVGKEAKGGVKLGSKQGRDEDGNESDGGFFEK